jgi:tetratricopeptide (TPR) repeat protein
MFMQPAFRAWLMISCLCVCCLPQAFAGEESLGALFLDEPVGARGAAMGEALVGVAEDANAVYWNPAGLVRVGRQELLLAHAQSYQDFRNEYAALLWPWSSKDAFGLNLLYSYNDAFDRFSDTGDAAGTYSLYDAYAGLAWSHAFSEHLSAGLAVKGLREVIDTYSAWSAAADVSVLYANVLPDLNLGWVVNNLGKPVVFISQSHSLDAFTELGAAYRCWDKNLLLTAAVRESFAAETEFKAGAEVTVFDILAMRAGYRAWPSGNYLGALAGLTLGLGIRISDYNLDYAYTPFPDLGDVHRLTVTLPFGRSVVEEQRMLEKLEKQVKAKQKAIFDQTVAEGDQYNARNQFEKALAAYNKAYAMNPGDGSLNAKIKSMEAAQKKKAADEYAAKGKKAQQEKDYLTALVEWSKVLELLPDNAEAQQNVTTVNQKLSAEKLSAASHANAQQIDQYFQNGLKCMQNGHYTEALDLWKKILALDPNNSRVTQYLRVTQTKMEELAQEMLRLADHDWEGEQYVNAVKKWRQVAEFPGEAAAQARAALENRKAKLAELAEATYKQGLQQYIQNDLDGAINFWQNVQVLDPKYPKIQQNLEQAKKKRRELDALQ